MSGFLAGRTSRIFFFKLLIFFLLPRSPTSFKNEDSCEGSLKVNKLIGQQYANYK